MFQHYITCSERFSLKQNSQPTNNCKVAKEKDEEPKKENLDNDDVPSRSYWLKMRFHTFVSFGFSPNIMSKS